MFVWTVRMSVRREQFLQDAFSKVMAITKKDLHKAKLFISFTGEEGWVFTNCASFLCWSVSVMMFGSRNGALMSFTSDIRFCSLPIFDPNVGHTIVVLSPFICPLSFWLTLPRGVLSMSWCCPSRPCVVFLACGTWHCSLHYLFLQATLLFPHDVTIVC